MMKRLYQIALVASLLGMVFPAQAAVKRYSCNFEKEADRNRWVLNPVANQNIYNQLTNKWYMGAPGNNGKGGQYGLFISDDNGQTAHYSNKGCWIFAYDTVSLEHLQTGDYSLSFDYCVMANMASEFDGLYLLWIPYTDPDTGDTIKVRSIPSSSGTIPSAYENYVIRLQPMAGMDYLNGTSTWRQHEVKIPNKKCDGKPHYLAFVWTNGSNQAQQPGAIIDNIEITDDRPCAAPTDLTVTPQGSTISLSWSGTAAEYEVSAYSYDGDAWFGPKIVSGTQTNFTGLPIGQTDFIVRAICDSDHYSLKTIVSELIYYPDEMCVDYLNLKNANCYVHNSSPTNTRTFNDFRKVLPWDNGPAQSSSRHTVHFDRNETEPRTGGMAKTVPDGELASVRLGNWESNNEAERIEFSFDVDTIQYPVLLLKYLPILEAPGHEDHENPRFKLDILINGQTIGECGQADFNCNDVFKSGNLLPGASEQGWHLTKSEVAQTSADIVWKEWTTVGVNLKKKEYAGKKLTARLTTHDCTFSAHCGYAYFTLSCSDGKLKGMKCGEINPVFEAPDGFNYRWAYAYNEKYRRPDGSLPEQYVLGHDQTFEAGMQDDSLYVVDCMFVQDSSCYFSLYASTLATNPIAKMTKPHIFKNCKEGKYTVNFDASPSWVQEIDHVKGDTLVSQIYKIDYYEWNVEGIPGGWSDEVTPTFTFPSTGGDYTVSLRTTCGTCDSTIYYHLHLDPLGATRDTTTVVLCDDARKTGYVWPENPDTLYYDYGMDSVVLFNFATSCDSILYINFIEPVRVQVDTMVLPESLPVSYRGRTYTQTMVDTIPVSATNCDTTWIFNFEVYESLLARLKDSVFVLCEGDPSLSLVYDIMRGRSLRYSYSFNDPAMPSLTPVSDVQKKGQYSLDIPLTPAPYPNVYTGTLLLEDSLPKCNVRLPFTVTVRYASSVIAQRWNDVLAIRNSDYNGGYAFDSVQWYIGETPIEGATEFNYYTQGTTLQFGQPYSARLHRSSDGVWLFTCPVVPVAVDPAIQDIPTLVPLSSPLHLQGQGVARWYDMLGRSYGSQAFDNSSVTTPAVAGSYLLLLQTPDRERQVRHVMVR